MGEEEEICKDICARLNSKPFFKDEQGQVSIELILVVATIIGISFLVIKGMEDTAKRGTKLLDSNARKVGR